MYIRIQELRLKHSLSYEDVATYLNITTSKYILYENGEREIPILILSMLARKYNTSIDYIVGATDTIARYPKTSL